MHEIQALRDKPASADEIERARTAILSGMVRRLERVGGFGGKSDRLAMYTTYADDTDYLAKDFARYQSVTAAS